MVYPESNAVLQISIKIPFLYVLPIIEGREKAVHFPISMQTISYFPSATTIRIFSGYGFSETEKKLNKFVFPYNSDSLSCRLNACWPAETTQYSILVVNNILIKPMECIWNRFDIYCKYCVTFDKIFLGRNLVIICHVKTVNIDDTMSRKSIYFLCHIYGTVTQ